MKSVHSGCSSIHLRGSTEQRRSCAEAHKRVSLSGLQSEASMNCSQCMELFSSFLSDSSSALPLVRAYFSSLLMCLLSRAKPEIHRKKETVLKPNVRPRYTILQKGEASELECSLRGLPSGTPVANLRGTLHICGKHLTTATLSLYYSI